MNVKKTWQTFTGIMCLMSFLYINAIKENMDTSFPGSMSFPAVRYLVYAMIVISTIHGIRILCMTYGWMKEAGNMKHYTSLMFPYLGMTYTFALMIQREGLLFGALPMLFYCFWVGQYWLIGRKMEQEE